MKPGEIIIKYPFKYKLRTLSSRVREMKANTHRAQFYFTHVQGSAEKRAPGSVKKSEKIAFFCLQQAEERNFLSSYSRNLGFVDLPIPVHVLTFPRNELSSFTSSDRGLNICLQKNLNIFILCWKLNLKKIRFAE